ncbi:hypothetical protein [Nocardioides immobilis]|nr:hypothetical protein [Nocardioides immobilis]
MRWTIPAALAAAVRRHLRERVAGSSPSSPGGAETKFSCER